MAFPTDPIDVEVGMFLNGAWVDAVAVGNGVRVSDGITISRGRSNWASQTDPSRARFTLDNRDGRWSPDYASGAYAGQYKRNIPCRVGVGGGTTHLLSEGLSTAVASTPDIAGVGGGSPTAPAFVDVTTDAETTSATTHTFNLPATVAQNDRLLLIVAAGHQSLAPTDQGAGVTDLDDWTLVHSNNLYVPWHGWRVYEIEVETSAQATDLAGSTVQFSTTSAVKSSSQCIRTSGARGGGQGVAWDFQAPSATAFSAAPDPPSLTASYGADEQRWYAVAIYGSGTDRVTVYPSGYTSISDSTSATNVLIATAHTTTSAATENPGAYTLAGSENWQAFTFVYRAEEDASADGVMDIAGDIDLRIDLELFEDPLDLDIQFNTQIDLASKRVGTGGFIWELSRFQTDLHLTLNWWDSSGTWNVVGTRLEVGTPVDPSARFERKALRVTLDVDNGAAGHDVAFYYGDTMATATTQIGTTYTGSGTTSIKTNDAPLELVPSTRFNGRVFGFQMLDGIGGTAATNPDFTAQTVGASSFNDAAGRTWTIGAGGAITDKRWRFHGELSSLPVRWSIDGADVIAPVEAAGFFRRLRQGARPLRSAIYRAIIDYFEAFAPFGGDIQYWPLEEDKALTQFGAAVGTAPFVISGSDVNAAAEVVMSGSQSLPTLGASSITATVDSYTSQGMWLVHWIQKCPAGFTGDNFDYLRIDTTDMTWEIRYRDDAGGQLQIRARRGLTNVYASAWTSFNVTGASDRFEFEVRQNGSNVNLVLRSEGEDQVLGVTTITNAVAGSAGTVTAITFNQNGDVPTWAFGHVSLHTDSIASDYAQEALSGHSGEKAGERVARLCQEEGIAFRIVGDLADTEIMGPQQPGTFLDVLQECANTDLGLLHESVNSSAVVYRTRNSMRNQTAQAALDATAGEVARSLELDRDDQDFSNDVTVRNWSGATARTTLDDGSDLSISQPPTGAGRYDSVFNVNSQDGRLSAIAANLLTLSTADEPRVSRLSVALHHSALVADATLTANVLDLRLGDLVTIANNLTVALGTTTLSQILQGYTERIAPYEWQLDMLTSPGAPWGTVAGPADPHSVSFRAGTDLATSGQPDHVLTALGYTAGTTITRSQLDGILDTWVASTGGTTRNVTSLATWNTAIGNAVPGDLVRVTTGFDALIDVRGNRYSLSGENLTTSPAGGLPGLPIIVTCADTVYVDDNNTSSNAGVLDLTNCEHVWAVGFNVRDGQFGIRCQNWGGSAGFPAYVAYCDIDNIGDAALVGEGWFQAIATSGGTPPSGAGNEWGFSNFGVFESNTITNPGRRVGGNPGEGIYLGHGGSPGWIAYVKDFWVRGNVVTGWTSDAIDLKPGCHRVYITDNEFHTGHAINGSPMHLLYVASTIDTRASSAALFDADPEIWVEGNRVYDNDITSADASSVHIMGYVGLSGIRIANNVFWAHPTTATHATWRFRNEKGTNDTEALAEFRADPTWIINNTCWNDDIVDEGGYGAGATAWPTSVTGTWIFRNNIRDDSGAGTTHGDVEATSADFIATVPAIGAAGAAQWLTYGNGSAFDLDPTSALVESGASITDITLFIEKDISNRDINKTKPNPGAFQPHPANQ